MRTLTLSLAAILCATASYAADDQILVTSKAIVNGKPIAEKYAFCAPDGKGKTKDATNISPDLSWAGAPAGTKSFAILVVDPDVPAKFDDANKDGKTIAADFPRQDFYHWVLTDIPATTTSLAEGKDTGLGVAGTNDFASFMKDEFTSYDGPCPPWNDARVHNYHFTVYALDVEKLGVKPGATGKEAKAAIDKHTLAKGEITGTFSNLQSPK